jgi:putative transcriptional regulator
MARRKVFKELKGALEDALRYERGEPVNLRATELPAAKRITPQQIGEIRQQLNASPIIFAKLMNVSPNTVESWEQGVRRPRQAALKLLAIARKHPQVLLEA